MTQKVRIIALGTAACLLQPHVSVAESGHVLLTAPVPVIASADAEIFPKTWRKEPVLASGDLLSEQQIGRARTILAHALKKYPPEVLKRDLKAVYVLSELRYSGVITSGTNSRTSVYLKIGDVEKGFTDAHIEGVFHAEFSSILLRNHSNLFDKMAWQDVNPPGFKYLGNGVDAVKQKKARTMLNDALHESGFLVEYCQSTMENDLNGFAKMLFNGETALWKTAAKFSKIRRKLDLALTFYQKLTPTFTEEFFRRLTRQGDAR